MYREIQSWKESGLDKASFITDKEYSKAKFEYWINKYNKEQAISRSSKFKEINLSEPISSPTIKNEKLVDLDLPSGIKITVYK